MGTEILQKWNTLNSTEQSESSDEKKWNVTIEQENGVWKEKNRYWRQIFSF